MNKPASNSTDIDKRTIYIFIGCNFYRDFTLIQDIFKNSNPLTSNATHIRKTYSTRQLHRSTIHAMYNIHPSIRATSITRNATHKNRLAKNQSYPFQKHIANSCGIRTAQNRRPRIPHNAAHHYRTLDSSPNDIAVQDISIRETHLQTRIGGNATSNIDSPNISVIHIHVFNNALIFFCHRCRIKHGITTKSTVGDIEVHNSALPLSNDLE